MLFLTLETWYSRPASDIINEAKILLKKAQRKFVLLGQNVNAYSSVQNKSWNLARLIREIANLDGIKG